MDKKRLTSTLYTLLILVASLATPQFVQSQYVQYEQQIVDGINIVIEAGSGATSFHEKNIRSKIKTRENQPFSQLYFDRDLKALANDYDRIEPTLQSINGKMHITLHVWPKPVIRSVTFNGNCKISADDLRTELGIASCTVFDRRGFNAAFHKLKAYYVKQGFFEAQLNYDTCYIEETNEIDVNICINEGRAGHIKKILFSGLTQCEEEDLCAMMYTKEYNFFLSWLTFEGLYSEEAIQQDQFIIINYLQNKGYADAQVDIEVCEAKEQNRIIIKINVCKGERYKFGRVTFEGNTIFTDEEICNLFCFKIGCPYSSEKIRNSIERITNLYGGCGYIDAFVNFEPNLDCENQLYSVNFTIEEGEQYHVGMIKILGNCSTQSTVILHETLLTPGEVFNLNKLKRTERRLANMGFFKNVNVYAVRTEDSPSCLGGSYRDVHIEIEEDSTGSLGGMLGFSTTEDMFAGVNITERNFNIAGFSNLWRDGPRALRGGGEYAHITLTVGQKSRKYILSWTKPYFLDTDWCVGFDLEKSNTRYISDDYDINALSYTLHGVYDYNAFVNLGTHYRIRHSDVDVHSDHNRKRAIQSELQCGVISAVGATAIYDSTNSIQRPSCGFRSKLETELAGIWGDFSFFSIAYVNTYYKQIGERDVLKFRADMRFIQPFYNTDADNLPLDERIFLGGDNEIRGYRPYRLGPKFPQSCKNPSDSDDPKGGISMQLLSAEYQRMIMNRFDAFVFCDAGYLSEAHWDFGRLYTSIGIGARLQVMDNGPPLTIGLGFPLNAKEETDVKKFFLTIGGRF